MNLDLVLYGASVRALASSATSAGLRPMGVDLFADWDLKQQVDCRRVDPSDYPAGLLDPSAHPPGVAWMYTGGLENYPELLDALAECGPLLGNRAEPVRLVRDPIRLARLLTDWGLSAIPVSPSPEGLRPEDDWLIKPVRSGGGRGIVRWNGGPTPEGCILQKRTPGVPHAAVYWGTPERVKLIGVTRQLVGEPFCHAASFAYCGSIGPIEASTAVQHQLTRLGEALAIGAGLRGVFGVDLLLDGDQAWPVEVNPRFTASVEALERSFGCSLLPLHLAAFSQNAADWRPTPVKKVTGKVILFADAECSVHLDAPCYDYRKLQCDGEFADVPHPGAIHQVGEPILTLFARADSWGECHRLLQANIAEFRNRWLKPMSIPNA